MARKKWLSCWHFTPCKCITVTEPIIIYRSCHKAFRKSGSCVSECVCISLLSLNMKKRQSGITPRDQNRKSESPARNEKALTESIGRERDDDKKAKQTDSCFAIIPSQRARWIFGRGDFYIANTSTRYFITLYWREGQGVCWERGSPATPPQLNKPSVSRSRGAEKSL